MKHLIFMFILMCFHVSFANATTLWKFEGEFCDDLQTLLSSRYQEQLPGHLLSDPEIEKFIQERINFPKELGCLDDSSTCKQSASVSLLSGLGVSARVMAICKRNQQQYEIKLIWENLKPFHQDIYVGKGSTLEEATSLVIEQSISIGYLQVSGVPESAEVKVDDVLVGKGSGKYPVSAGSHQLSIKANDFKTFEQMISIVRKEVLELKLSLDSIYAELTFDVKPVDAELYIDGEKFDHQDVKKFALQEAKSFRIQVMAAEHQTYDAQITLSPEEKAILKVNLPSDKPVWKIEAAKAHPDLFAKPQRAGLKLSFGSTNAGAWPAKTVINQRIYEVTRQMTPLSTFGFDTNVNSELGPISSELFAFSYLQSNDQINVKINDAQNSSLTMDGLKKINLRFLWLGYQFPAWRLAPFIRAGMIYTYEWSSIAKGTAYLDSMDLSKIDSAKGASISYSGFKFGWELGVRIQASPLWHAQISWGAETWFGVRSMVQTSILIGYALDLFKF